MANGKTANPFVNANRKCASSFPNRNISFARRNISIFCFVRLGVEIQIQRVDTKRKTFGFRFERRLGKAQTHFGTKRSICWPTHINSPLRPTSCRNSNPVPPPHESFHRKARERETEGGVGTWVWERAGAGKRERIRKHQKKSTIIFYI